MRFAEIFSVPGEKSPSLMRSPDNFVESLRAVPNWEDAQML
jgi:hypothetical protein